MQAHSGTDPGRALAPRSRIGPGRILTWSGVLLFLAVIFFYPLVRIFGLGLDIHSLPILLPASSGLIVRVLSFTLLQALASMALTLALGLPAAYLFSRFRFTGRTLLRLLTAVPFMLPTVVVAAGYSALLGPRGWLNLLLMKAFALPAPPIALVGTLGAILLAHVFYNTTIIIRMLGAALARQDPHLGQAARSLGAGPVRLFRTVTWPYLRPTLLAACLLVFLFDFSSFGVILLLGGPRFSTLEVEIYQQALQLFDLPLAALLALIQLLCTLVFSVLYSRVTAGRTTINRPQPAAGNLRRPGSVRARLFVAGMAALLLLFFTLPLVSLPARSVSRMEAVEGQRGQVEYGLTGSYYRELFINRQDSHFYVPPIQALANSLAYAGLTVVISLALGFPAARMLARPTRLEGWLEPLLILPLGASAVTLGLGYLVSFGRLLTSPWLVPLAHSLIALPFVIRTLQPALASIPERLRQAAAMLGAGPGRAWFTVDWPIVARATLSAAVFAFTVSLGEFGAASLIVRPDRPTLPVAIARFLSQPGGLNYGQAMAMATLLMLVCMAGILVIEYLRLPGAGDF